MKLTSLLATTILTTLSGDALSNPQIKNERLFLGKVLQHPAKPSPSLHLKNKRPKRYLRNHQRSYTGIHATYGWHINSRPMHHWRTKPPRAKYYRQQNVYYIVDHSGYRRVDAPKVVVNQAINVTPSEHYQLGKLYNSLPIGAEPITISDQQYFKYHDIYFLAQISGDKIKYLAVRLH
jgi:hypothetical protein